MLFFRSWWVNCLFAIFEFVLSWPRSFQRLSDCLLIVMGWCSVSAHAAIKQLYWKQSKYKNSVLSFDREIIYVRWCKFFSCVWWVYAVDSTEQVVQFHIFWFLWRKKHQCSVQRLNRNSSEWCIHVSQYLHQKSRCFQRRWQGIIEVM